MSSRGGVRLFHAQWTTGHIQHHHLSDARVVVPQQDVLCAADQVISPVLDQMLQQRAESRTLAALRGAQLPMLISGELRVKDAERFVGRAV